MLESPVREIELSAEQQEADFLIRKFLAEPYPARPWFNLQGLAGTGKSTVLAQRAKKMGAAALMGAFTGKAASVLSRKTGLMATTVHSAIYTFRSEFVDEYTGKKELVFDEKVNEKAWRRRCFFLDESSMVPDKLATDLIRTGARIVTGGDPGQLQPVNGTTFFCDADYTLQEVRRQTWDSPIIRQAHRVRYEGRCGADGDDFKIQKFVERDDLLAADMILCWRNATRRTLNELVRAHRYMPKIYACAGEPVMCLKNNHEMGVLNGAIYTLVRDHGEGDGCLCVTNERGGDVWIEGAIEGLSSMPDEPWATPFAFAYASTVHKAQGSEWNRVIVVDEYNRTDERREWLYTAITRSRQSIIVQRDW